MEEVTAVLPVTPWALAAVATVLVVALSVPPGGPRTATAGSGPSPVAGRTAAAAAAMVVVALVLLARLGPVGELRNPVPALVLGLGWPLLLLVPALVGLVRPVTRPGGTDDVRPAVLAALALVGYLSVPVAPTRPAAVGTALAAYALVVLAASVAFGRAAVAARFEVLGLLVRWCAVGRAVPSWAAPRGAPAVLAVLLGGVWFERYERTTAWTSGLPAQPETVAGLVAAVAVAAVGALALHLATRTGAAGTAAAVLLPLTVGMAVAGVARRALISAQLLADQAVGPRPVDPDPLGVMGGQLLALALVVLGGGLACAVLARRMGEETARLPGVGVVLVLSAACAWVVLQP